MQELDETDGPPVYYFFFRHGSPLDNSTAALRSILSQVAQRNVQDDAVVDSFSFAMTNECSSGQSIASQRDLTELLKVYFESSGKCYMVIDGIDECVDETVLIEILCEISQCSKVRIIMLSRPTVTSLSEVIQEAQQLLVGSANRSDISTFLHRQLRRLSGLPTITLFISLSR